MRIIFLPYIFIRNKSSLDLSGSLYKSTKISIQFVFLISLLYLKIYNFAFQTLNL